VGFSFQKRFQLDLFFYVYNQTDLSGLCFPGNEREDEEFPRDLECEGDISEVSNRKKLSDPAINNSLGKRTFKMDSHTKLLSTHQAVVEFCIAAGQLYPVFLADTMSASTVFT